MLQFFMASNGNLVLLVLADDGVGVVSPTDDWRLAVRLPGLSRKESLAIVCFVRIH